LAQFLPLPRLLLLRPALHLYGSTLGGVLVLLHRLLSRLLNRSLHRLWRFPHRRPLFQYSRLLF